MRRLFGTGDVHYYHVVSRVVDRRFVFGEREKAKFRELMRALEGFSGIRILTYCLMDNHFHLLLEIRAAEGRRFCEEASVEDVLRRLDHIYERSEVEGLREQYELASGGRKSEETGRRILQPYLDRMYDLSSFMRDLKQRFSRWYNGVNARRGTLWEERYRSVLCEGNQQVLTAIAAYIDLNPVRAGIVGDPASYRWSGFGEAASGGRSARFGLDAVLGEGGYEAGFGIRGGPLPFYHDCLYGAIQSTTGDGIQAGGDISTVLRSRVRQFTEGRLIDGSFFSGNADEKCLPCNETEEEPPVGSWN